MKLIIKFLIALLALPLVGFVLYFVQGSLEEFPTPEQQEKVRIVSGMGMAILLFAEGVLFLILRKIKS